MKAFFGDRSKDKTGGSVNRRRQRGVICFSGMISSLGDDPGEIGKPPLEVWALWSLLGAELWLQKHCSVCSSLSVLSPVEAPEEIPAKRPKTGTAPHREV